MELKHSYSTVAAFVSILAASLASGGTATVLSTSFEVGEAPSWTVLRNDAYAVSANTSFFQGSNLDGVAGDRFLLFGSGNTRGKIRFVIPTAPGRTYTLSYACGGTDTQRFPIGSGPGFELTFKSLVQAYHGKKTVTDHYGMPIEIDDLENLDSRTHPFSTPGSWNWRIHSWLPVSYSFVAKSSTTWIEFDTPSTNGMASVGVLDQVQVATEPFAEISIDNGLMRLDFAGMLQESGNLGNWVDVSPQPVSPMVSPVNSEPRFFRVAK